jgi:hypothetical protein
LTSARRKRLVENDEYAAFARRVLRAYTLRSMRVRDDAWSRMKPEYRADHLRPWTDLTRLAQPGYVPAPASLLAFVA